MLLLPGVVTCLEVGPTPACLSVIAIVLGLSMKPFFGDFVAQRCSWYSCLVILSSPSSGKFPDQRFRSYDLEVAVID